MTSSQEASLAALFLDLRVRGHSLYWAPDSETCRKVTYIGEPPSCAPDDEPEPSWCAYFEGGEYVALYNVEVGDFLMGTRVEIA